MPSVELGSAYVEVRATQDKLKGDLDKAHSAIAGRIGDAAAAAAKATAVAFAAIGVSAAAAGASAVKLAGDLQQSVANISTIKPEIDTSAVFNSLNEMSRRVPQSAQALGDSLYNVFSSVDVSVSDGLALVEKFAKGATGAGTSAETFGTAAIGVLNAYKLSASDADHISDVFFNTIKNGVVTGEELAGSLGPVTQSAQSAGVSLDELGALIAGVTKEGGPAAQNINNLNNFLMKLSTKEAQAELNNMGVATRDAAGGFLPIMDVLGALKPKLEGMTESAKANALQAIFPDAQARIGASVLISQLDNVKGFLTENQTVTGATASAYEKMSATFNSQSKLLANTFESILTEVGGRLLPGITPLITTFAQTLPGAFQRAQDRVQPFIQEAQNIGVMAQNISKEHGLGMIEGALSAVEIRIGETLGSRSQQTFHDAREAVQRLGTASGDLVTALGPLGEKVVELVGDRMLPALATHANNAAGRFAELTAAFNKNKESQVGLADAFEMTFNFIGKVNAFTVFTTTMDAAHDAGFRFGQMLASLPRGFEVLSEAVERQLGVLRTNLETNFAKWGPMALQAGKDLAMGFANGITFGAAGAAGAAWQMGANAIAALRSPKGVDAHSPSRKGEEAGEDLAEGFAQGITELAQEAADAAAALGDVAVDALTAVAAGVGAVLPQVRDLVAQAQADINEAVDEEDRRAKRDRELEEIKHGRTIAKLETDLGKAKASERAKINEDIKQAETTHLQRLEDLARSHGERVIELEYDAGDKIAAAKQKQAEQTGAALAEFARGFEQLNREVTEKAAAIGKRINDALALASAEAVKATQETWDKATAAMEQAAETLTQSRVLRGIRDVFAAQQDASALTHSKERDDAETTYKRGLDLKELEYQRDQDLAKAKRESDKKLRGEHTDDERKKLKDEYDAERDSIRQRFEDAKADMAHRQQLEDAATKHRIEVENAERDWRAKQEQARRDFEDGLEAKALQKNIQRMADERDERIKAIQAALTEKQAQIVQQEKDERAALNASYEEKVKDLRETLLKKLPALTGEAKTALDTFLDGVASKVQSVTGDILTNTAKVTSAFAWMGKAPGAIAGAGADANRLFSPGDILPSGYQTLVTDNVINDQGEVRVHRKDEFGNWHYDVHKERVDGKGSYGQNSVMSTIQAGAAALGVTLPTGATPSQAAAALLNAGTMLNVAGAAAGGSPTNITIELDGVAVARAVVPYVSPEIDRFAGTRMGGAL